MLKNFIPLTLRRCHKVLFHFEDLLAEAKIFVNISETVYLEFACAFHVKCGVDEAIAAQKAARFLRVATLSTLPGRAIHLAVMRFFMPEAMRH